MALDFTPDNIRKRFKELTRQHDRIDAKLAPLRDELDTLVKGDTKLTVKQAGARETEVRSEIRKLQNELAPIEQERALCARALGGKTA